jgi:hypothetical protein
MCGVYGVMGGIGGWDSLRPERWVFVASLWQQVGRARRGDAGGCCSARLKGPNI